MTEEISLWSITPPATYFPTFLFRDKNDIFFRGLKIGRSSKAYKTERKSVLSAALGPLACPSRSTRPPPLTVIAAALCPESVLT